ncbi:MAG TPA: ATP-binding protein [Tepidisphaeraceae bacterium]|nr:ATP-binding protein [Tepidisphaeraceae bacterium]
MGSPAGDKFDYTDAMRSWLRRAPWYRRVSNRFGLQGKLVLCIMLLISLGLGASSYMFLNQSRRQLGDMIGEQGRQISSALALASKSAMTTRNRPELERIGHDLLKSRNILFVAFTDVDNRSVAMASRDPDFTLNTRDGGNTQSLMQVRPMHSATMGEYIEVVAPILHMGPASTGSVRSEEIRPTPLTAAQGGTKLLGFVTVGVSQTREQAELLRINLIVVGIGCAIAIISLPMAYVLVHRIFQPIRQLVDATNKIAGGELDASVAIDRPDIIGTLARSFNEMVIRVRRQQQALEDANDRLAEANRDLEEKVHQRTTQLETANKRLSSEIAEKEDFLRAVSHDLNAPLRNIAGMASMLLMKNRERFDEDVIHRLERIQKNVQVETDLIAELLELSRIKTRRQRIEPVDIGAMVHELGGVFENDLKTRNIALVVDSSLPVLECERARMRQVFQNLIDNAIKYMGDGPNHRIHIGCMVWAAEAEFYVSDTGIGIDPEDIDKVFFVFRRGKNCGANTSGKGVGLASVKSIVETYNGRIWVESQLGIGTTFRFTINGKYVPQCATSLANSASTEPARTGAALRQTLQSTEQHG